LEKTTDRLESRLGQPIYELRESSEKLAANKSNLITLNWDQKVLTLSPEKLRKEGSKYFYRWNGFRPSGILPAIVDVFFQLSQEKGPLGVYRISLREVESFLRDENHQPVFELSEELSLVFEQLKTQWALSILISSEREPLESLKIPFLEIPLMKQIGLIRQVINSFLNPCLQLDGIQLELVALIKNRIFLKSNTPILDENERNRLTTLAEDHINFHFGGITIPAAITPAKDNQYLKVYLE
jgi:hypothetical protein